MTGWNDFSIRYKLAGLVLLASGVAVLFASLAFYSYERKRLQDSYVTELESFVAVIAGHATAAMRFQDMEGAEKILRNVMVKSDIQGAYLCDATGEMFAQVQASESVLQHHHRTSVDMKGVEYHADGIEVYHPIRHEGQFLGHIALQASLKRLERELNHYALLSFLFGGLSLGVAFLVSKKLQERIFKPISHLSSAMERVSATEDYSQQVDRESDDEMGQLIDGYNRMLGVIQNRDSELRRTGVRLNYLATHDMLTGLPNRNYLHDQLATKLRQVRGLGGQLAVLFLDLDRFKAINDTLGHDAGDHVLKIASSRLRSALQDRDVLARIGGDEFVVLVDRFSSHEDLARVATRLRDAIGAPFVAAGHEVFLDVSIGISTFPEDGQDGAALLKQADMAMYKSKKTAGKGYAFYDLDLSARAELEFNLESDLRHAIERDELSVHYQPQVELHTQQLIGFEALLRWQHPTRGWISPMDFIPIAEQSGLILPIGTWVLEQACRQNQQWMARGISRVPMAVNISPRQFRDPELANVVERILSETGLAPESLELEITESALFDHLDVAQETIMQLKKMGVSIALDDFGTGYSSLSNVRNFPLDKLKIDRSFVQKIGTESGDLALVESIVLLGKAMGIRVIAEGVSEDSHLALLLQQGCREGQGFYFGRPLPPTQVEALLHHGAVTAQEEVKILS